VVGFGHFALHFNVLRWLVGLEGLQHSDDVDDLADLGNVPANAFLGYKEKRKLVKIK